MTNYLYGILEDNSGLLIYKRYFQYLGLFPHDSSVQMSSQPFTLDVYLFLSKYINLVFLNNFFIMIILLLNIYVFYRLIKRFISDRFVSLFLSIIFGIAPYIIYHSFSHLNLVPVFLIVFGIERILVSKSYKDHLLLGLYLAFATLASNYYGYFLLIFYSLFVVVRYLVYKLSRQGISLKTEFLRYALSVFTCVVITGVVLFPYVKTNFLNGKDELTIGQKDVIINGEKVNIVGDSWKLEPQLVNPDGSIKSQSIEAKSAKDTTRTLEEFFYFTSRPWYLFLPAPANPFFGGLTLKAIDFLQNDWGYWLTTNYFPSEHVAGYLGWINFVFALVGLFFIIKKLKKDRQNKTYWNAIILGIVAVMIAILTLPPYLTISLHKIYLPSYLLYLVFPMFRSLARMGMLVLIVQLIFTGYGYLWMKEKLKITKETRYKYLIFIPFFLISFMEFHIPPIFTDVSKAPAVFSYIKENTPNDSSIVIYPSKNTAKTIFWVKEYQRQFINPAYYDAPEYGFYSDKFTDSLATCQGILEARNLGVDYLIYTEYEGMDQKAIKNKEYISNTPLLTKIKSFEDTKSTIYQINQEIDYQSAKQTCLQEMSEQTQYNNK